MKHSRLWMIAAILTICGTAAFASCTANDDNPSGLAVECRYVPLAADYSDPTMWITEDGDADGTGADVFYVVSTWEDDWTTAFLDGQCNIFYGMTSDRLFLSPFSYNGNFHCCTLIFNEHANILIF